MPTRPVHTAGGIIVDGEKILLIQHKAGGLAFAKGHIEPGESPEVAAVREVAEETGYLGKNRRRFGQPAANVGRENGRKSA